MRADTAIVLIIASFNILCRKSLGSIVVAPKGGNAKGLAKASEHWTYDNQDEWSGVCTSGSKQSPINIDVDSTVITQFPPFVLSNYHQYFRANVTNNGHTVKIILQGDEKPTVSGGGFPSTYALDSIHFHWSSEHTVKGYRYPAELHAVHYDIQHEDADNATNYENGLVVLAVLFEISPDDDTFFDPVMSVIEEVGSVVGREVELEDTIRADIFLPRDVSGFYRYSGSLTTPTCDEVVIWTVFTSSLHVSSAQIAHFTSVWSENTPLIETYRSIQDTNGRRVYEKVSPLPSRTQEFDNSSDSLKYSAFMTFLPVIILNVIFSKVLYF